MKEMKQRKQERRTTDLTTSGSVKLCSVTKHHPSVLLLSFSFTESILEKQHVNSIHTFILSVLIEYILTRFQSQLTGNKARTHCLTRTDPLQEEAILGMGSPEL